MVDDAGVEGCALRLDVDPVAEVLVLEVGFVGLAKETPTDFNSSS